MCGRKTLDELFDLVRVYGPVYNGEDGRKTHAAIALKRVASRMVTTGINSFQCAAIMDRELSSIITSVGNIRIGLRT